MVYVYVCCVPYLPEEREHKVGSDEERQDVLGLRPRMCLLRNAQLFDRLGVDQCGLGATTDILLTMQHVESTNEPLQGAYVDGNGDLGYIIDNVMPVSEMPTEVTHASFFSDGS